MPWLHSIVCGLVHVIHGFMAPLTQSEHMYMELESPKAFTHMQMTLTKPTCLASLSSFRQLSLYHGIQDHHHLTQPVIQHPSTLLPTGQQLSMLKKSEDCLRGQLRLPTETKIHMAPPWVPHLLCGQFESRQPQGRVSILGLLPGLPSQICCRKAGSPALCVLLRGHLKTLPQCRSS